jgi:REP element-mobilizing transposase RayT
LKQFQLERNEILNSAQSNNRKLNREEESKLKYFESRKIQEYLDRGVGDCWLRDERIAKLVFSSIQFFDGRRYINEAFCIMPNHLHWLLTPLQNFPNSKLSVIAHSIKSFTSKQANRILIRQGRFWSREYYDHCVKSAEEFERLVAYTIQNPVKAGLCGFWKDWPYTYCRPGLIE